MPSSLSIAFSAIIICFARTTGEPLISNGMKTEASSPVWTNQACHPQPISMEKSQMTLPAMILDTGRSRSNRIRIGDFRNVNLFLR